MASEADKIQSHFYCPHRRRYIGPLPSCYFEVTVTKKEMYKAPGQAVDRTMLLHFLPNLGRKSLRQHRSWARC